MAALINAMTPVAVTILAAIILKGENHPGKMPLPCTGTGRGLLSSPAALPPRGDDGNCGSSGRVVSFAAASVYMRRLTAKYPAVLVTTYSMAISLIFHIPVGIVTVVPGRLRLLRLGGNNPVSWICGLRCGAVYLDKMSVHAACQHLFPVLPITASFLHLLGAWLLGETFTPAFFIGLMLISLDVVLNTWEARQMDKALTAKESSTPKQVAVS